MAAADLHYLEAELNARIREDPRVFAFLQQAALDGLWYWDLEQPEHEWMNAGFWELLGYDPAEMPHLASAWQDIIHPEDLQKATANFLKHVEDPSHPYDQVVRYTHKKGHTIWVRCRGMAIRNAEGKAVRMMGAHTDVTELKAAEEDLSGLAAELKRSNEDLERFAYAAAHDLKSPLRTVASFSDLVRHAMQREDEERAENYLAHIKAAAIRMNNLVDGLLAYAQVGGTTSFSKFPVAAVLEEVRMDLAAMLAQRGGTVTHGELGQMIANRTAVHSVLLNLIRNSITYAHPDRAPRIDVQFEAQHDSVTLSVSDNGLGIPADQIDGVQGLFKILPREGIPKGTGVGLAICKRSVETAGGRLEIESEEDRGTTVHIHWPHPKVRRARCVEAKG